MYNVWMVLDGVDVFVRVVEAGGFSAAARLMGMPVTTVSAKIARLEERLGVTLIQRSTRKMHVTAAGEAYYRHCAEAMRALEAGEAQLEEASAEPSGVLRLTAPSDIAQTLLPRIVGNYLKAYSRAGIELIVTNEQVDLLAEGVDLALRASPMKDSSLQSRKFGSASLALFASRDYLETRGTPQNVAELKDHDLLVHSRFPPQLTLSGPGGDRRSVAPGARLRADDMQTLRALAASGSGIALLPNIPGAGLGTELVRVLPKYETQSGNLYFVYPAGRFTPVNVRAFIDMALENR